MSDEPIPVIIHSANDALPLHLETVELPFFAVKDEPRAGQQAVDKDIVAEDQDDVTGAHQNDTLFIPNSSMAAAVCQEGNG